MTCFLSLAKQVHVTCNSSTLYHTNAVKERVEKYIHSLLPRPTPRTSPPFPPPPPSPSSPCPPSLFQFQVLISQNILKLSAIATPRDLYRFSPLRTFFFTTSSFNAFPVMVFSHSFHHFIWLGEDTVSMLVLLHCVRHLLQRCFSVTGSYLPHLLLPPFPPLLRLLLLLPFILPLLSLLESLQPKYKISNRVTREYSGIRLLVSFSFCYSLQIFEYFMIASTFGSIVFILYLSSRTTCSRIWSSLARAYHQSISRSMQLSRSFIFFFNSPTPSLLLYE
jgi:hypothetical protein